jgi:hypothetical protein
VKLLIEDVFNMRLTNAGRSGWAEIVFFLLSDLWDTEHKAAGTNRTETGARRVM